jgi:DeoR/GlpR family transcriptional regulator of sugar metabolism
MHNMQRRLAHERQDALKSLLAERGTVAVSELARRWRVSEMTVRRDLAALEAQGAVARVHGGAVAGQRLRFSHRLERNRSGKSTMAAKLARLVPEHGSIYLDGSTTIYHLVAELSRRGGLIAATNNIDTFLALHACPGVTAILVGGELNRETDNLVGVHARRSIEGMSFAAVFCSAFALHPEVGPSEPAPEDAEVKRLVCQRAERICLAVDHAKLGQTAAGCWGADLAGATLVTDLPATDHRLDPYRGAWRHIL